MPKLERGVDPRSVLENHKERGLKRYEYTILDVARVTGYAISTVRNIKNLDQLEKVMDLLFRRLRKGRINRIQEEWSEKERQNWENRWPKLQLTECLVPGCGATVLGSDLCEEHGCPVFRLERFFMVRLEGGWVPLHKVILQPPKGMGARHKDGNKWNNRMENLEAGELYEYRWERRAVLKTQAFGNPRTDDQNTP